MISAHCMATVAMTAPMTTTGTSSLPSSALAGEAPRRRRSRSTTISTQPTRAAMKPIQTPREPSCAFT